MAISQARRPGTKTIDPPRAIAPGETVQVPFASLTGGPRNQEGYLRKYLPFQAILVDSYNGERIEGSLVGSEFDPIPANTARTFDSIPAHQFYLRNPAANGGTVGVDQVKLIGFTTEADVTSGEPGFSAGQFLEDLVPGVSLGIRTER